MSKPIGTFGHYGFYNAQIIENYLLIIRLFINPFVCYIVVVRLVTLYN